MNNNNNWISVKDKLPEKASKACGGVCVWVYAVSAFGTVKIQTNAVYTSEGEFVFMSKIQTKYVTHWQYYPNPPK